MKRKAIYCWFIIIFLNIILLSPIIISSAYADTVEGDVNGDSQVDLKDVVLILQLLSRITPLANIYTDASVNNDDKIGIKEAIYVLQVVSGMRTAPHISSASVTDANGQMTVNIFGKPLTFELKDEATELPIKGLDVGFAANTNGSVFWWSLIRLENIRRKLSCYKGSNP
jgi:hypothetical protein